MSNHAHVLVCLNRDPRCLLKEVAAVVGITERATQRIVSDLEEAGILTRHREGRRNRYEIDKTQPLRHILESHRTIGEVLQVLD